MTPRIQIDRQCNEYFVTINNTRVGESYANFQVAEEIAFWLKSAYNELAKHFSKKTDQPTGCSANPDDYEGCITAGGAMEKINVIDDGMLNMLFENHLRKPLTEVMKQVELLSYHEGKASGIQFANICGKQKDQTQE